MDVSRFRIAGPVMVLLIVASSGQVLAQSGFSCSDTMAYKNANTTQLKRMFQIAAVEEWAFNGNDKPHSCITEDGEILADAPYIVSEHDVLAEIADNRLFPNVFGCSEVALLKSDDGQGGSQYHITCHGSEPRVELAIRLSLIELSLYYLDPGDGEITKHVPHFSIEVDIVVPESLLTEQIQVSEATFVDSNNLSGHREKVFLIRGTDIHPDHLRPQFMTTIQGAMGDSCAFSSAAMLIRQINRKYNTYRLSTVAGHSLGGTATQYIATDQQRRPSYYLSEFEAYSFNGLGLPTVYVRNFSNGILYSYTVDGDWINGLRRIFGQAEAGVRWKYKPGNIAWGPWGVGRHSMESVRESLCRCLDGKGTIDLPQ